MDRADSKGNAAQIELPIEGVGGSYVRGADRGHC
jgi:hypothetical protein